MAKQKRISLIAKGKNLLQELFSIKVKRIERAIESAKDSAEEYKMLAEESFTKTLSELGEADTPEAKTAVINNLFVKLDEIEQWKLRKSQIEYIKKVLNEEVEVEEEN